MITKREDIWELDSTLPEWLCLLTVLVLELTDLSSGDDPCVKALKEADMDFTDVVDNGCSFSSSLTMISGPLACSVGLSFTGVSSTKPLQ